MIFKCKMCGGDIKQIEGKNIGKCEYCKSIMTLPNSDNERIINLYNRANNFRLRNDFDKAYQIYESILNIDNNQIEAHWGLLLCKYGVEYVDDPRTGKKIPTCHRTIQTSIFKDPELLFIKKNSFGDTLKLYEEEATIIDLIQKKILDISSKEEPYDIFICYKESNQNNERTHDSVIAQDIYEKLTEKGYKVFFARITLEDKLGSEYEPYIYSALLTSKVMLVVGTCEENFNSVWVKNEWSRFLEMMKTDKRKSLIPVYSKIDAYKLPEEFAMLQAQSMDKIGAMQDLIRGVEKIIEEAKGKKISTYEVDKIKQVMEEASNLGNGRYEVVVAKEKTGGWYYVFIFAMIFILIITALFSLYDKYSSIYNYYIINFGFVTLLKAYPYLKFMYLISIVLLLFALIRMLIARKYHKNSKLMIATSLFLYVSVFALIFSKGYIFNKEYMEPVFLLFTLGPLGVCLLSLFVRPKWHIDSSSKIVTDSENRVIQMKKNEEITKNFKEYNSKVFKKIHYIVFTLLILIVSGIVIYNLPITSVSNDINENVNQVLVNETCALYYGKYDKVTGYVKKGDYLDVLDELNGKELAKSERILVKNSKGKKGYLENECYDIVFGKNDPLYGKTQSNELDATKKQVKITADNLKIRAENGDIIGIVYKDEIYTVLKEKKAGMYNSNSEYQIKYKIETNFGIKGWIANSYEYNGSIQYYVQVLDPII